MRVSIAGMLRLSLAALAGAGLVVGATHLQGAVAVGSSSHRQATTMGTSRETTSDSARGFTATVRGASLVCPGPELTGVPGVADLPVGTRLAAAAAPLRALTGTALVSQPGQVTLSGMPSGSLGAPVTRRAASAIADLAGRTSALVTGTQSLAPGLAAAQTWWVPSGDHRALTSAPCATAGAEFWILAGGAAPGRQERLVLTNPGGNPVSVDLTLHGPDGPVSSANGKGIVVPAHGRTAFLLDSISGSIAAPAVHVVAQGGVVGAVINDLWLDGTRAAGSDDAVPAAAPSRDQVIPAVLVAGPATLRVAVPGDTEAVVQARVLTADGPRALPRDGVVRVAGGTVKDIDLSSLPPGSSALQVRADVPIVAAAMVSRSAPGAPSDFAWSSSTPPISGVAGMPLVQPAGASAPLARNLMLTATHDSAGVEVVTVDQAGTESSQRISLQPDATTAVSVTGASSVWVHRLSGRGEVRAGVLSWTTDPQGTLLTVTPLLDTALRTTTVGLREAAD